jgi:hypothetical protein
MLLVRRKITGKHTELFAKEPRCGEKAGVVADQAPMCRRDVCEHTVHCSV